MLILEPGVQYFLSEDARSSFPRSCSGFVFGHITNGKVVVRDVLPTQSAPEITTDHFADACDWLRAEHYARTNQFRLLGIYQSHPNRPAEVDIIPDSIPDTSPVRLLVEVYGWGEINIRCWQPDETGKLKEFALSEPIASVASTF